MKLALFIWLLALVVVFAVTAFFASRDPWITYWIARTSHLADCLSSGNLTRIGA